MATGREVHKSEGTGDEDSPSTISLHTFTPLMFLCRETARANTIQFCVKSGQYVIEHQKESFESLQVLVLCLYGNPGTQHLFAHVANL